MLRLRARANVQMASEDSGQLAMGLTSTAPLEMLIVVTQLSQDALFVNPITD